jgi:hypothetical protein
MGEEYSCRMGGEVEVLFSVGGGWHGEAGVA